MNWYDVNIRGQSVILLAAVDWSTLASIGFVILLPLVPAVILYKLFEQKTVVTGPFKGLRLDLSGAFAGYFLLLIVSSSLLYSFGNYQAKITDLNSQITNLKSDLKQTTDLGTPWKVRFLVKLKTRDGREDQRPDPVMILAQPLPRDMGGGEYEVSVLKEKSGERARFPALQVSRSGYYPQPVPLEASEHLGKQYNKNVDEQARLVEIVDPVELQEK